MKKLVADYLISTNHWLAYCEIISTEERYGGSGLNVKIKNECSPTGFEIIQVSTFDLLEFMWSKIE